MNVARPSPESTLSQTEWVYNLNAQDFLKRFSDARKVGDFWKNLSSQDASILQGWIRWAGILQYQQEINTTTAEEIRDLAQRAIDFPFHFESYVEDPATKKMTFNNGSNILKAQEVLSTIIVKSTLPKVINYTNCKNLAIQSKMRKTLWGDLWVVDYDTTQNQFILKTVSWSIVTSPIFIWEGVSLEERKGQYPSAIMRPSPLQNESLVSNSSVEVASTKGEIAEFLYEKIVLWESKDSGLYGAVNKRDKDSRGIEKVSLSDIQRRWSRAVTYLKQLKAEKPERRNLIMTDPRFEDLDKTGDSLWDDTLANQFKELMKDPDLQRFTKEESMKEIKRINVDSVTKHWVTNPVSIVLLARMYNAGPEMTKSIMNGLSVVERNDPDKVLEAFQKTDYAAKKYPHLWTREYPNLLKAAKEKFGDNKIA